MRNKLKHPVAVLSEDWQMIKLKNINLHQLMAVFYDIEINSSGALKRFSSAKQESNYFFINSFFLIIRRKITNVKKYNTITLYTPAARCFVNCFSRIEVSNSTLEIIALLNQKLPILC